MEKQEVKCREPRRSELEEWTLRLEQVPVYTNKTFIKHVRTYVPVQYTVKYGCAYIMLELEGPRKNN